MSDPFTNYSFLNCYQYEGKSDVFVYLDWFSTPCRSVLGGRDVYVKCNTYDSRENSTARNVCIVAFSILFFPVGILAVTSLVLKMFSFPCFWEKRKVQEASKLVDDRIDKFEGAFERGKWSKALGVVKEHPELLNRNDIQSKLFKTLNYKINEHGPWSEIQLLMPSLSNEEATSLIDHAVKVRINFEISRSRYLLSGKEIVEFIYKSLMIRDLKRIEECYKFVLENSLCVKSIDNPVRAAWQMELADHLIQSLTEKKSRGQDELHRNFAEIDGMLLRKQVVKCGKDSFSLSLVVDCEEKMQEIRNLLKELRSLEAGWEAVDALGKREELLPHLQRFREVLNSFPLEQQECLSVFKTILEGMIAPLQEGGEANVEKMVKEWETIGEMVQKLPIPGRGEMTFITNIEAFLYTARLYKLEVLMKIFKALYEGMIQAQAPR